MLLAANRLLTASRGFMPVIYEGVTLKMSTVNGSAFITQVSGSIPWASYLDRAISISDGTQVVTGFVKAAGTDETLGEERFNTPDFSAVGNWVGVNWTIAGGNATHVAGAFSALYQSGVAVLGGLHVVATNVLSVSAGNGQFSVGAYSPNYSTTGIKQFMATATETLVRLCRPSSDFDGVLDYGSLKQILTPDASGITVVSTLGGATQNWASNGGINPNAASFTITIS